MRNLALLLALVSVARQAWTFLRDRVAPELACIARSLAALVYGYLATTAAVMLIAGGYLIATWLGLAEGTERRLGPYLVFAVTSGPEGTDLSGGPGLIILSGIIGLIAAVWVRLRCAMQIRRQAEARAKRRTP